MFYPKVSGIPFFKSGSIQGYFAKHPEQFEFTNTSRSHSFPCDNPRDHWWTNTLQHPCHGQPDRYLERLWQIELFHIQFSSMLNCDCPRNGYEKIYKLTNAIRFIPLKGSGMDALFTANAFKGFAKLYSTLSPA